MQDIAPLFNIVITIGAVVTPVVLFARLLDRGEPFSLAALFYTAPDSNPWPHGVQEEEPTPGPSAHRPRPAPSPSGPGARRRPDHPRRQPSSGATANRCENCLHQIRTLLTADTSVPAGTRMLKLPSVARSLPTSIESSV